MTGVSLEKDDEFDENDLIETDINGKENGSCQRDQEISDRVILQIKQNEQKLENNKQNEKFLFNEEMNTEGKGVEKSGTQNKRRKSSSLSGTSFERLALNEDDEIMLDNFFVKQ